MTQGGQTEPETEWLFIKMCSFTTITQIASLTCLKFYNCFLLQRIKSKLPTGRTKPYVSCLCCSTQSSPLVFSPSMWFTSLAFTPGPLHLQSFFPKHSLLRHLSGWFFLNVELLSQIPPHHKDFHDFPHPPKISRETSPQSEECEGFKQQFSWRNTLFFPSPLPLQTPLYLLMFSWLYS